MCAMILFLVCWAYRWTRVKMFYRQIKIQDKTLECKGTMETPKSLTSLNAALESLREYIERGNKYHAKVRYVDGSLSLYK